MKRRLISVAVVGLAAAAAYFGFRPAKSPPALVDPATLHEGTLTLSMPPQEVFKRALWRRPAPDDKILHAERREWAQDSTQGVDHWQWFLAVEPGPGLKKWLRESNPFSVQPAGDGTALHLDRPPGWFPTDFANFDIQSGGPQGSLVFLWSRNGDTLYATDAGTGFTPGAPESTTAAAAPRTSTPGRLPSTPPPTSPKQ